MNIIYNHTITTTMSANLSVPSVERTKNTNPDKGGEMPVGVVAENNTFISKLV